MEVTVSATEFKARCLELIDRVEAGEITSLQITKHNVVKAQLVGPRATSPTDPDASDTYGWAGTLPETVNVGDFVAPSYVGAIQARDGETDKWRLSS